MESIIDDNRLILIISEQSMAKIHVVINWYRLLIPINRKMGIDWLWIDRNN